MDLYITYVIDRPSVLLFFFCISHSFATAVRHMLATYCFYQAICGTTSRAVKAFTLHFVLVYILIQMYVEIRGSA